MLSPIQSVSVVYVAPGTDRPKRVLGLLIISFVGFRLHPAVLSALEYS